MHGCQKEKPPFPEASSSNGAAYRIPRIRFADPHRLRPPAGVLARSLRTLRVRFTLAPRPRFEPCMVAIKEKPPFPEASSSSGAAYRIRTYDVLIRSQTLYPAEVTPRLVDYYAQGLNNGQAFFQKKLLNLIFTHLGHLARSSTHRDIRKAPVAGSFKINWCGV